jgi:tetratricopeptide (TPR) repeat protein
MDWPGAQPDDREIARRMARAAIDGGADSPLALALGGAVHASLTRDHDFALAAVDRAMMINANAAAVLGFDALTRCVCGSYDAAIEHAEKALQLSPLEPLVYHAALALALACLLSGRTEDAIAHARKAIEGNATSYSLIAFLRWDAPVSVVPTRPSWRCAIWSAWRPAFAWARCARSALPTRRASNPTSSCSAKRKSPSERGAVRDELHRSHPINLIDQGKIRSYYGRR